MGKDKKKKHKKKHKDKKKDTVSTDGWTHITLRAIPTATYGAMWWTCLRTQVPQIFQDAFDEGELEP